MNLGSRYYSIVKRFRDEADARDIAVLIIYATMLINIEMEEQDREYYDEHFTLKRLAVSYGRKFNELDLLGYFVKLEVCCKYPEGFMTDDLLPALARVEPDVVRKVFEYVNLQRVDSKEQMLEGIRHMTKLVKKKFEVMEGGTI